MIPKLALENVHLSRVPYGRWNGIPNGRREVRKGPLSKPCAAIWDFEKMTVAGTEVTTLRCWMKKLVEIRRLFMFQNRKREESRAEGKESFNVEPLVFIERRVNRLALGPHVDKPERGVEDSLETLKLFLRESIVNCAAVKYPGHYQRMSQHQAVTFGKGSAKLTNHT
jgi:hypothetical protein